MRRGARWKQVGGRQAAVGSWRVDVLRTASCRLPTHEIFHRF